MNLSLTVTHIRKLKIILTNLLLFTNQCLIAFGTCWAIILQSACMFTSFHSNAFLPFLRTLLCFFLHPVSQKHNICLFDVHLKQAEETTAGPRRSTPPCACVTSLTQAVCVCVCSCFNGPPGPSGSVQAARSLAHSHSPPAVTVGHNTRSHTRVIWCGFLRVSLHILFALKTELPTTHTLHFLSYFIALLSTAVFEGCWNVIWCERVYHCSHLTGMRFWSAEKIWG